MDTSRCMLNLDPYMRLPDTGAHPFRLAQETAQRILQRFRWSDVTVLCNLLPEVYPPCIPDIVLGTVLQGALSSIRGMDEKSAGRTRDQVWSVWHAAHNCTPCPQLFELATLRFLHVLDGGQENTCSSAYCSYSALARNPLMLFKLCLLYTSPSPRD